MPVAIVVPSLPWVVCFLSFFLFGHCFGWAFGFFFSRPGRSTRDVYVALTYIPGGGLLTGRAMSLGTPEQLSFSVEVPFRVQSQPRPAGGDC